MNKSYRYISISHKTANTKEREKYHISEEEKEQLSNVLSASFKDITGLFILATCNRTEIYFESVSFGLHSSVRPMHPIPFLI